MFTRMEQSAAARIVLRSRDDVSIGSAQRVERIDCVIAGQAVSKMISRRRFAKSSLAAAVSLGTFPARASDANSPKSVEAVVIGSGFGGAVASLRLGMRGMETVVLERGRRWRITDAGDTFCTKESPDGRSTWLKQYDNSSAAGPRLVDRRFYWRIRQEDRYGNHRFSWRRSRWRLTGLRRYYLPTARRTLLQGFSEKHQL
jgi:hypothetical protein